MSRESSTSVVGWLYEESRAASAARLISRIHACLPRAPSGAQRLVLHGRVVARAVARASRVRGRRL
eukprot:6291148-Lingulodinium_polyedra.AAC.1